MSTPRLASLVLVAAGYLLASGCAQHDCSLAGGYEGLFVVVQVTGTKLAPGTYTLFAQVGDLELTADAVIREDGSTVAALGEAVVANKHLVLDGELYAESGTIRVRFREGRGPALVTIGVRRGTTMLAQETYTPTYRRHLPNGEGCLPELEQARGDLAIAAP